MAAALVYVSRVMRLPLLDAEGAAIGRVVDVVLSPPALGAPPRVLGFVAVVQRRRIFVNAGRVGEVDTSGVRLHSGTIDLRHFQLRSGELLAVGGVMKQRTGGEAVSDIALRPCSGRSRSWEVASVALGSTGPLRRRSSRVVGWETLASLFDAGPVAREVAAMRAMHPSDVAQTVRHLSPERRRQLAEVMEDEQLADLLEELPEDEQVEIMEDLDVDRAAHVLEEMNPDDAADLLAEMPGAQRSELLAAMPPDEAGPLRRLLLYDDDTAGGLMTPEPVIVSPEVTVAECLARLRDADLPAALAAQVFVVQPPTESPTGPYLGAVGFQRLLREPPSMQVGRCVDDQPGTITSDLGEVAVAERLASYNLLALAVSDEAGRLVGAVTVDDVLDRTLPEGWRER